jgi:hypothetical protein
MQKLIAGVVLVGALIFGITFFNSDSKEEKKQEPSTPPVASRPNEPAQLPEVGAQPTSVAAGRERRAEASYKSPGGEDRVAFTVVTSEGGVIADARAEVLQAGDVSKKYVETFSKELPMMLKGKKLSELTSIDKVSGASLTTDAFNTAIGQLKGRS